MSHPIFKEPRVWKWQGETLSNFTEHPFYVEQLKVKILSGLLTLDHIGERLRNYFNAIRFKL